MLLLRQSIGLTDQASFQIAFFTLLIGSVFLVLLALSFGIRVTILSDGSLRGREQFQNAKSRRGGSSGKKGTSTSAYSITSLPVIPACSLLSHPILSSDTRSRITTSVVNESYQLRRPKASGLFASDDENIVNRPNSGEFSDDLLYAPI